MSRSGVLGRRSRTGEREAVEVELAQLCVRASTERHAELGPEVLAEIARPYRYLVDLAGEDGIPLTAAGWMKPAYVQRIYQDLALDEEWIGMGNREDQTGPVLQLRETCQQVGLLRKHKGRLLRTRLARSLTTDEGYVELRAVTYRVRPVWVTLEDVTGRTFRDWDVEDHPGDHRAVALARAALWPEG